MNFLSISDAKASDSNTVTVLGNVLKISDMESYKNKTGEERSYFTIVIADSSTFSTMRIYNKLLKSIIQLHKTYAFMNCLKKNDSMTPFWGISSTQIVAWSPITVPQAIVDEATRTADMTTNSPRKLAEALTCLTTSTVQGKVVQTSPVKYVRDGNLALKHVALKDTESKPAVTVSLFGADAERNYDIGNVISITDVYKYKQADSLSTKPTSKIEFHPAEVLPFDIKDSDVLHDEIYKESQDETFTIHGIKYAYIYQACSKFACKNKKLKEGRCPNCGATDASPYCIVRVIVEHNHKFSEHSLFRPEISRLLDLPALEVFDNTNTLMNFVSKALPIQGRGTFIGEKMSVASVKRKSSQC